MSGKDGYAVTLGDRGRLVLPASLRRRLRLQTGDRLILNVEAGGGLNLVPAREQARALRGLFQDLAAGRSLVDELIEERREEAAREDRRE
jgi:AbrB family looped-hinge helix DNA binding protein